MYRIEYASGDSFEFDSQTEWEEEIDFIAEDTCYDIDMNGNVAFIDDGDYDE